MQLKISGQKMEITAALHDHVAERLEKITRHFDHVIAARVVLSVEKNRHTAEVTVNAKGAVLHAAAIAADMYAAIDAMAEKLDRQIVKHKEKLTDHHRHKTHQPPQ